MATAPMSTSRLLGVRPSAAPKTPFSTVRPARAVRVTASAQDNQGPKDVVLKTFGALAAVQLALLPTTGTAIANIIPNQTERAEINQKTSDLPTFGQVGDALKKNLGQNDPKDIGKAIERNTPDLDLTKNPKDIGKDIKRGIEKNTPNLPDLSEVTGAQNLAKQPNFFKGEGEVNATNEIKNKVKDALPNLPSLPNLSGNPAQKAADKVQSDVGNAANKARNVAGDLSEVTGAQNLAKQPNFFKGEGEVNATNEIKNKVKDALPNLPSLPNLSGNPAQKAADKVQSDVGNAANKAKNVASDISDLPNPFKGNADPQNLANDAKNAVKGLGSDVGKNIPNAGDAKSAIDKNTPNLPNLGDNLPNLGDGLPNIGGGLPGSGQTKDSLNIPRNS